MLAEQRKMMTQPLNMMSNPMMGGKDYKKILEPEKESINIISNFSLVDDSVDMLIKKYSNN